MLRPASRAKAAGFDLTPMIDIVMLLIVFFALTMQFQQEERMIDLPRVSGAPSSDQDQIRKADAIVAELDPSGLLSESGHPIDVDELIRKLQGQEQEGEAQQPRQQQRELVLRADRHCTVKQVNVVASALARAGVSSWSLSTAGAAQSHGEGQR